jgi:hypothetical protein
MSNGLFQRACALVVTIAFFSAGMPLPAYAGIIDTATYVESTQRAADLATLSAGLNRAEVRDRLAGMGVDANAVDARLAGLTDAELRQMAEQMEQMPAGGDALAVIGIVFVVLVILELVGIIDIFKRT